MGCPCDRSATSSESDVKIVEPKPIPKKRARLASVVPQAPKLLWVDAVKKLAYVEVDGVMDSYPLMASRAHKNAVVELPDHTIVVTSCPRTLLEPVDAKQAEIAAKSGRPKQIAKARL